jgi:ATP-dependent NAD(P)H-hydrate dehydratase
MSAAAGPVYDADAEAVVRRITPPLDRARHKGQAGELAAHLSFLPRYVLRVR